MKNRFFLVLCAIVSGLFFLSSCQKEATQNPDEQLLSVYLTDGAEDFEAVNIDIIKVEAKVDSSSRRNDDNFGDDDEDGDDDHQGSNQHDDHDKYGKWVDLKIQPRVINVFELRNGVDQLLGAANITGTVRKLRLTLGDKSTVVVNGTTFPLKQVNDRNGEKGKFVYVKLKNKHRENNGSNVNIWLDFDISRSVKEINGEYFLLPFIKPFNDKNFASVSGKVTPSEANPVVTISSGSETFTAIPNNDGKFKFRGLEDGTYTVVYIASNGFKNVTVNNVEVKKGKETKLDQVVLVK